MLPSFRCSDSAPRSGYCAAFGDLETRYCRNPPQEGDTCDTQDPLRPCGPFLVPVGTAGIRGGCCCEAPPSPSSPAPGASVPGASQRAKIRARREFPALCSGSHTACATRDGYECVDLGVSLSAAGNKLHCIEIHIILCSQNSLERCGGCSAAEGGMDCTALPNVEAVGCDHGACKVLSCAPGYEHDSRSGHCAESK